jgi:hypothetical protein
LQPARSFAMEALKAASSPARLASNAAFDAAAACV